MRRFSILDIMIVVSAVAVGSVILRECRPGYARWVNFWSGINDPTGLHRLLIWVQGPSSCVVVPLMAAVIVMRLQSPRPRRGRLVHQPGFLACVAAMASLVPGLIWAATIHHRPGFQRAEGFEQSWTIAQHWTPWVVLGSWLALALARRWRPERSWIDRAGRVLGFYWIFLLLAGMAIAWINKLQTMLPLGGLP